MKDIKKILKNQDKNGFTVPLKGNLKRFVIGITNNTFKKKINNKAYKKLNNQLNEALYGFKNISIGGRIDKKTNKNYIDIGTTTNSLDYAKKLAKYYNQIAIFDLKENKEILI